MGGKVGNDSRRVLVEGLVREEGNRDNVDNRSYGGSISMVLGVGKNPSGEEVSISLG
jgi:hypothetical protein